MYFLEFLETCTIRWVSFCEDGVGMVRGTPENAFFEFFLREVSTTRPPALSIYPRGGDPSPQRTRTDCTAQAAAQAAPGRSGRRRGWTACNPSIMCIMIALSQAWYIDSILYKYHTNILLHLVIVNYYLSIDTPSY